LSGRRNRIGDLSMRGLVLAAGVGVEVDAGGAVFPRPFALAVEDDRSTSAVASAPVDRLVGAAAIAVVGPGDARPVEEAAARATALGVPLVSLTPAPALVVGGGATVFHIVHSAEQRAAALARHALGVGGRSFAILRPANRFGVEVARSFAA